MKIPTDLAILDKIYKKYYHEFASFNKEEPNRNTKVYVPIDVNKIGEELGVDGDIIFGRLYYHLNNKFRYLKEDGVRVEFFANHIGPFGNEDTHCVQFPYLVSVLADLKDEDRKFRIATLAATVSIFISIVSLIISIVV
ncbi:MAG: hypothetical protein RIB86_21880 [Imperialibacter sp.]